MKTLKLGSKGEDVRILQRALNLVADGKFGEITREAVIAFQKNNGLEPDGIVGKNTWAKLPDPDEIKPTTYPNLKKSKRNINMIIVHCTATPEGREVSVEEVNKWHKDRGFAGIGYHYLVDLNGIVHEGRDVDLVGAHTSGYNTRSVGVCYVGGTDAKGKAKDTRTPYQKDGLLILLTRLKQLYPYATIHSHREFANKSCPCFDAAQEYKDLC